MAELRSAVYVAPYIPAIRPPLANTTGPWSPICSTLVHSVKEAVFVDTPMTTKQTEDLIKWIKTAPNRKLSYIYVTHGYSDHSLGIPLILKRFPEVAPVISAVIKKYMIEFRPDRFNTGAVALSAVGVFLTPKEARI